MIAARLVVRGRVQGVGYRAWAVRTATALGVAGWVRNRADGSVEILAAAAGPILEEFVAQCRAGPRHAQVGAIERSPASEPVPPDFTERPSR